MKSVTDIINGVLHREGSKYTNDPSDPGGPTKYGITLAELQVSRGRTCTAEDVKNLTAEEAHRILVKRYYVAPRFNEVGKRDMAIAGELTDTGVNLGVARAGMFLQRSLNLFNREGASYKGIVVDGIVGNGTLAALDAYLAQRRKQRGEVVLLRALNTLQGERYFVDCEHHPSEKRFAFGWFANRVEIPS